MTTDDAKYGKSTNRPTIRQPIQPSEPSGRCSGIGPKAFLGVGAALWRNWHLIHLRLSNLDPEDMKDMEETAQS